MPLLLRAAVVLLIGAVGCSSAAPRVYRYRNLGFSVVRADQDTVDRVCRKRIKLNDKGREITRRIRCCYLTDRSIWVAETDVDCIFHELCHADGRKPAECDRVY